MSHPLAGKSVYFIVLDGTVDGTVTETLEDGKSLVCVYSTERQAKLEIADNMLSLIQEFKDGGRDDVDCMEYVMEGEIDFTGHVYDESGFDWGEAGQEFADL